MAELLVRVRDKVNADLYLNCQCTKRGDVIVAAPDGWKWGADELSRAEYRILQIPSMTLGEAQALTAPEINSDPLNPSKTLLKRAFKINVDDPAMDKTLAAYIADDKRALATINLDAIPALAALAGAVDPVSGNVTITTTPTGTVTVVGSPATVSGAAAYVSSIRMTKPPVQDPAVIGFNPIIIGP